MSVQHMLVRPCDHIIIIMILPTSLPSSLTYTGLRPAQIGHICGGPKRVSSTCW